MDTCISREPEAVVGTGAKYAHCHKHSVKGDRSGRRERAHLVSTELGTALEEISELSRSGGPVLLLHGFFSTPRTLRVLERRLRRDGYHVLSVRLGGLGGRFNTRRIDSLAELVRARVERLYSRCPGLGPLTVVGHSKGGLVASYWVKRLGGHQFVRAVITMGTPHNGTPWAWMGLPIAPLAPSVLQMAPRCAFIRRLQEGAWPAHVRLISLYSRSDRLVPYPSAVVDAQGQAQISNVEVTGGHSDFLLKRRAYQEILRVLRLREDQTGQVVSSVAA